MNLIIKYNDDVSPLGIENNRSIFPLCKFAVNLLFFVVKSYSLFFVVTCAISGVILSEGNGLQDTKLLTDKNQRGVSHRDCYQRPEIRQN